MPELYQPADEIWVFILLIIGATKLSVVKVVTYVCQNYISKGCDVGIRPFAAKAK